MSDYVFPTVQSVPYGTYGVDTPEECVWCEPENRCPWCSVDDHRARFDYDDSLHAFWESLDIVPSETSECLPWTHPETGEVFACYCAYRQELARSADWHSCDTA